MSPFEGAVLLDGVEIPVIVSLEAGGLVLSSNGAEIGRWQSGEFSVADRGSGAFAISAENETLEFFPAQPEIFGLSLAEVQSTASPATSAPYSPEGAHLTSPTEPAAMLESTDVPEGTSKAALIGLYALSAFTAGLGIWAFAQILS
jgi:hypothetical protein